MHRGQATLQLWVGGKLMLLGVVASAACWQALASASDPAASSAVPTFQDDIRPLLQAKCTHCHGDKVRKGELDLTTLAGVLKGGESGMVVVAGKPDTSLLYEKVHTGMMPPKEKDRLSEAQVVLIRRWIETGAKAGAVEEEKTDAAVTQHDVLPILLRRCTVCHGAHKQEGGLDVRTKTSLLHGGKSGPAMVVGKPDESLVIKKVRAEQMPPRDRLVEVSIKPIEPAEIETLAKWIAAGAPEVPLAPDVATTTPDPLVTDKDRDFWAFHAPQPVMVPNPRVANGIHNPIDVFILQKLGPKGLTLAPEADRATLLRRVSFDLTGLSPTPAEAEAFLNDRTPDAYEKLIDRLLASPRYGERWGRHWLDVAGYAESEGKREQDLPRPHAWRYRDYVIRAYNDDKPYDRFLLEQLAGDELADYENAPIITPELYDNLVATGFLRMAPDPTWANITGFVPDRLEVIADEIDVLGSGVMGLTLKCVRCHSHKFDPIPQRDYYRLVDVFKGAFDEHDWLKPEIKPGIGPVSQDFLGGRHLPFVTTAERRSWEARKSKDEPEPRVQALWDRGEPSPTYIYRRGDPLSPGRLVGPGVPSVLTDGKTPFVVSPPWPGAKKTGRRLAFAHWLIQPDHPLTARVEVNRIWKHHFGTGIVPSLGNFGKAGTPPTHPELLDWMAQEFIRQGWNRKAMHRVMLTSSTYRQSSAVTPEHLRLDPENALYSRMPLTRLSAEALYDTMLFVSGRLDETPFGPADKVQIRPDGLVTPAGTPRGHRRLIYVQQTRKQMPTHLENFDYPQMNPNCLARRDSTVAPQALHLLNNGMIDQLAEHLARRVLAEVEPESGNEIERVALIERTYRIALSRPPSAVEKRVGIQALQKLADAWTKQQTATNKPAGGAQLQALTTYCHAILNSAEFLYVD